MVLVLLGLPPGPRLPPALLFWGATLSPLKNLPFPLKD